MHVQAQHQLQGMRRALRLAVKDGKDTPEMYKEINKFMSKHDMGDTLDLDEDDQPIETKAKDALGHGSYKHGEEPAHKPNIKISAVMLQHAKEIAREFGADLHTPDGIARFREGAADIYKESYIESVISAAQTEHTAPTHPAPISSPQETHKPAQTYVEIPKTGSLESRLKHAADVGAKSFVHPADVASLLEEAGKLSAKEVGDLTASVAKVRVTGKSNALRELRAAMTVHERMSTSQRV